MSSLGDLMTDGTKLVKFHRNALLKLMCSIQTFTFRRKHRSSKHRSRERYEEGPLRREPSGYDDFNRRPQSQGMGPPNRDRHALLLIAIPGPHCWMLGSALTFEQTEKQGLGLQMVSGRDNHAVTVLASKEHL